MISQFYDLKHNAVALFPSFAHHLQFIKFHKSYFAAKNLQNNYFLWSYNFETKEELKKHSDFKKMSEPHMAKAIVTFIDKKDAKILWDRAYLLDDMIPLLSFKNPIHIVLLLCLCISRLVKKKKLFLLYNVSSYV